MGKSRLIPAAFLLATTCAFVVLPPSLPRGTVMSSLLDDLAPGAPRPSARSTGAWHVFQTLVTSSESNERCSSASLTNLPAAEADARANDRDWCHVNDYWAADIAELIPLTGTVVTETDDPAIRLIELSILSADDPLQSEK